MRIGLRDAMRAVLADWRCDLDPAWREVVGGVELAFDQIDPDLTLEVWEPIFPARRGKPFPGAPRGAHLFRAFDGLEPSVVRCVILGQDPYPCPAFATGRAFDAGNVASWRELEKMFSTSVRTVMQLICAARTGDASYARSTSEWPRLLADIESGRIALEPAAKLADRWVRQGVLLLNAALTLSRFQVNLDPHQALGHLPLWRPLIVAVLRHLAASRQPLICIGFGKAAAQALHQAGIGNGGAKDTAVSAIILDHPAGGDAMLAGGNPFVECNLRLQAMGVEPVDW
ncbi:MAG: uracil-DNA glycosylase [Hyphomicrobiales bacterium]